MSDPGKPPIHNEHKLISAPPSPIPSSITLTKPPSSTLLASSSPKGKLFSLPTFGRSPTSTPPASIKDDTERSEKGFKGFWKGLGEKKRRLSSSSVNMLGLSDDTGEDLSKTLGSSTPATLTPAISSDPLIIRPAFQDIAISEEDNRGDPFHQAVTQVQTTVDNLGTAASILGGIAAGLELGAGWLPGVGSAVQIVVIMLKQAQTISMGKVAALRLVERSATILLAIHKAVIDNGGRVSPPMQNNISRLMATLHRNELLLTKLAERSFLKLYLNSSDTTRRIAEANEDLQDCVVSFHLSSEIGTSAWQEQSRLDHEHDMDLLLSAIDEARKNDQSLLKLLEVRSEQQQEAIKTLQRTLDLLLAYQARDWAERHPGLIPPRPDPTIDSPASLRSYAVPLPVPMGVSTLSLHRDSLHQSTPSLSSIDGQYGSQPASYSSTPSWSVPSPKKAQLPNAIEEHKEFCEHALDVLRRHSQANDVAVPDWTITDLEVTHDRRISTGYFSVVWQGRWHNENVALKELNATTDRALFIHEVDIWRQLRSPHILPFLGASSTTGPPPWFLVSPFMRNGDILAYLRGSSGKGAEKAALIHQIAQGMDYLHGREILHGDLKVKPSAANVLIDDIGQSVICDFGLSRLKVDITTRSHDSFEAKKAMGGTMRWQSPERLQGGDLTRQCDVYSFAMVVYEIYTDKVPFGYVDDLAVKEDIIKGVRPPRPDGIPAGVWSLVVRCWNQDPAARPTFPNICGVLARLYKRQVRQGSAVTGSTESSYITATEGEIPAEQHAISPQSNTLPLPELDDISSSSGSIRSIPQHLEKELSFESDRAERHYRHYLQHDFDDRLTVPLWFPSHISLGSVGYIRHGQFVKLLDAQQPAISPTDRPLMPFLDEFSSLQTTTTQVNVRDAAGRGLDLVTAAVTNFIKSSGQSTQQSVIRRLAFPLRPGMKQAALVVSDGECEIYNSFAEARLFLTTNINWILERFGDSHSVVKEDIILVVGALRAHHYAMMVSSFAPRTSITFSIHASPIHGQPWGTWGTDRPLVGDRLLQNQIGPRPRPGVEEQEPKYICKVSNVAASPMRRSYWRSCDSLREDVIQRCIRRSGSRRWGH